MNFRIRMQNFVSMHISHISKKNYEISHILVRGTKTPMTPLFSPTGRDQTPTAQHACPVPFVLSTNITKTSTPYPLLSDVIYEWSLRTLHIQLLAKISSNKTGQCNVLYLHRSEQKNKYNQTLTILQPWLQLIW